MNKPSVLLVDDEQHIADVVIYVLSEHGFAVIHALDGDRGLSLYKEKNPDLVILDLNLPGIQGLDLFREIRRLQPHIPVIMLTCRGEETDRVLGLELGADDYVPKPFSARELAARVKSVFRRSRRNMPAPVTELRHGPLICREDARQIAFFNQPLSTTRFEYEILKAMIRSPDRVFTRDQLIRLAYEEGHPVTDRAVDACIKRIRRKCADIRPAPDPIATLYGTGYRLHPDLECFES